MIDQEKRRKAADIGDDALDFEVGPEREAFIERKCEGDSDLAEYVRQYLADLKQILATRDQSPWERIHALLAVARELASEEREAFLKRECLNDQALYDEVRSLLAVDAKSGILDQTAMLRPFINDVFANRFRIVRHLGTGGMGEVYEAEDLELGERVALKVIRPHIAGNPLTVDRFKREIVLGKKVTHPNVCRIHDLGSDRRPDGRQLLFLTMKFLEGETLSARIKRCGPITEDQALPLIEDMAGALAAAHSAGVVHRDFKSGNVMLVGERAVVTDFGLARSIEIGGEPVPITSAGAVVGTIVYMAPEQVRGEPATAATDIYALGVVMFEMLTGRFPFTGDSDLMIALKHVNEPPPSPRSLAPNLDSKWDGIILGCLKKDPAQRFPSVDAVLSVLRTGSPFVRHPLPSLTRRKFAFLAALLTAAVGFFLWLAMHSRIPAQQRVAVLEFDNVGGDPVNLAFCDGLMETLAGQLTELEQFQGSLSVVPASDVRKEKISSARDAQRAFGVNLVITGSVQRSPGGARLIVNLVDARQLKQLRSHNLFVSQTDVVAMQQGVVKQVIDLLDLELRPEAQRRLAQGNTTVPGAYDFYLQGSGYLFIGALRADQAIAEFRHALDLDPSYALAYSGLGQAYWSKYQLTKDPVWISQAWGACQRGLILNPQSAASHIGLAVLNNGTGHYAEAMHYAQQAISIEPGNFQGYIELARAQERSHHLDEAEATLKNAISLRPNYWNSYVRLGEFYQNQGRYKDAELLYQRLVDLVPDNPAGYTDLGLIYHLEGREQEAEAMLKKSVKVRPTAPAYSDLATVYFFQGRFADAVPVMEQLVKNGTNNYLIWGNLGDDYRWTPGMAAKARHAYEMAMQYANQALAVNKSDAQALSSLALYQAKTGQLAKALANSAKGFDAAPANSSILFNSAIVYELAGKRNEAIKYLTMAARRGYSKNEIKAEPELSNLRKDQRYSTLIEPSGR